MFGFGRKDRLKRMWEAIGNQLRDLLAFPRSINGGQVPASLKGNSYVLGYHYMMCLHLYLTATQGKDDPEEKGFVLMNSLAIALEMDAGEVGRKLMPLITNQDAKFQEGINDANAAFALVINGNHEAFMGFNEKLRDEYDLF